jgi:ABC-type polar amino acid transport system ATPase subunit
MVKLAEEGMTMAVVTHDLLSAGCQWNICVIFSALCAIA